ncbi:uncharacterized protein LOC143276957 [Babylonia areolata]|uniref:uncharacterized protein LOC143276957 n=1 Tax=Babylonia areolata TaxID=304850 RepID=UPI003FCFD8F8
MMKVVSSSSSSSLGCGRWCFVSAVVLVLVLVVFVQPGQGLGAKCWHCNHGDEDEVCRVEENRYVPQLEVLPTFCQDIKKFPNLIKELCREHPGGYRILCELASSREGQEEHRTCQSRVCPAEKAQQTADSGATSHSHHAPGFLLMAAAAAAAVVAASLVATFG